MNTPIKAWKPATTIITGTLLLLSMMLATSCKNKVERNEYFGNLPAIYAEFHAKVEADNKKSAKIHWNDPNAGMKIHAAAVADEKRNAKYHALIAAEKEKVVGKDIPFTISKELQASDELYYEVKSLKIKDMKEFGADIEVTATSKINIPAGRDRSRSLFIYCRLIAKDGSTIHREIEGINENAYTVGQILKGDRDRLIIDTFITIRGENMSKFASIEFITSDEYDKERNEERNKSQNNKKP